ncbi:MAG: hypothetical protein LBR80_17385 [Deltaproteobacteria bacterium]|jgi:hypothetical protein|nr:hypothetical protein [Deltaproteobacteria bacterium]
MSDETTAKLGGGPNAAAITFAWLQGVMAQLEKGLGDMPSDGPENRFAKALAKAIAATPPGGQATGGEKAPEKTVTLEGLSGRLDSQAASLKVFMWAVGIVVVALGTCLGFILNGQSTAINGLSNTISSMSTAMETRLNGFEIRLTGVETRISGLETRISGLETRMETRFTGLQAEIKTLSDKIENLRVDVIRLQDYVFGPTASGADQRSSLRSDSPASGAIQGQSVPTAAGRAESRSE